MVLKFSRTEFSVFNAGGLGLRTKSIQMDESTLIVYSVHDIKLRHRRLTAHICKLH